jgi:hypothetical protein
MPKPSSDFQWPESSSDDDFVSRIESRIMERKALKPIVTTVKISRNKKQRRTPKANLTKTSFSKKTPKHSCESNDEEDIVSTKGEIVFGCIAEHNTSRFDYSGESSVLTVVGRLAVSSESWCYKKTSHIYAFARHNSVRESECNILAAGHPFFVGSQMVV